MTVQLFIDGKYVDAASGRTFPDVNPATGRVAHDVAEADSADVDRAVQAAKRALKAGEVLDGQLISLEAASASRFPGTARWPGQLGLGSRPADGLRGARAPDLTLFVA